jgi:MFS family permease
METEKTTFWTRALEVLRQGPFCRYIIGSAISDTGTWMQVMAQAWVMSSLTNKAILLGTVNFAAGLPTLALTMIGGAAADRYDKRMILIATQVVQIALAVLLGWLVLTNRIHIWHILVIAAILGVSIAFEMPAISALVPELVKRDQIATAVALDRSVFHGSRLVGPFMAGLIVSWWGAASAFFLNAFSFLALIAALISLPARIAGTAEEEEQRRSGIKEGFRYVASDRIMISMIALIALTTIFVFPVISVMLPLYVRNILQLGPTSMGWLMGVSGVGSLSGSLGLLSIARQNRVKFMTGNAIAVAASMFCMSRSTSFWLTALAMGFLAIGLSMNFGLANTIVQERAPGPLRGRISAVFGLSFFGLMPIGGLLVPGVSDLIGMRTALAVSSIIFGIGAFFILSAAGRHVCDEPVSPPPSEPEPAVVT